MPRTPIITMLAAVFTAVSAAIVLLAAPTPALAEKRVALVIGNAAYRQAPALRNPANDAADLSAALRRLNFEVVTALDVDAAALEDVLARFRAVLQGADAAVLIYAGHGVQVGGVNYLLPVDAQLRSEFALRREAFPFQDIIQVMEASARVNVVVIDACRDNPLAETLQRGIPSGSRSAAVGRGLARIDAVGGTTLIVFATAPGDVAEDGAAGRNSPMATALLRHIETPGVDVEEMLKRVTHDVRQATDGRQRPERLSQLVSRFEFRPAGEAAVSALPQPPRPFQDGAAGQNRREELLYWESVKDSGDLALIRSYLDRYPSGVFSTIARARLRAASLPPPAPQPTPAHEENVRGEMEDPAEQRITDYIVHDYLRGVRLYADTVDLFENGAMTREAALKDWERYVQRWPQRRFDLIPGTLQIVSRAGNRYVVRFSATFIVSNGGKQISGRTDYALTLISAGGRFHIAGIKEAVQK